MMSWLALSLVLSIVLTVALNLWLRAFPNAADRAARRLDDLAASDAERKAGAGAGERGVHVDAPWKAMLIGSLILTIVLNVVLRVF